MSRSPAVLSCLLVLSLWSCRLHPGEAPQEGTAKPTPPAHRTGDDLRGRGDVAVGVQQLPYRQLRQVTFGDAGADLHADVDPQGREIVFASSRNTYQEQIYHQPLNGRVTTLRPTFAQARSIHPSFSPDGQTIAFASDAKGNWDIYLVANAAHAVPRQLAAGPEDEFHPSWAPDGQRIVYCAWSPVLEEYHVWIHDLRTGQSSDLGAGLFPEFAPMEGQERIVLQRDRRRGSRWSSIWVVNTDGSQLTEIVASSDWAAIDPAWNRRGDRIVFATVAKRPSKLGVEGRADDIWVVDLDGRNLMQVTYDDSADWDPFWGPDGRIYFTSDRQGHTNIWSLALNDDMRPQQTFPRPEELAR